MSKPILGITMGDPFGNGPEITVRALNDKTVYDRCRPLVVGDMTSMAYALKVAKKVLGIDLAPEPREGCEGRQVHLRHHRRAGHGSGPRRQDPRYLRSG